MVAQKNIIKKVQIGVNTPSLENGLQLKDKLDVFFKNQIFPEMDNYFNSIQNEDSKIIRIEIISIEISIEHKNSLNDIQFQIMKALREKINYGLLSEKNIKNAEITSSEMERCRGGLKINQIFGTVSLKKLNFKKSCQKK